MKWYKLLIKLIFFNKKKKGEFMKYKTDFHWMIKKGIEIYKILQKLICKHWINLKII